MDRQTDAPSLASVAGPRLYGKCSCHVQPGQGPGQPAQQPWEAASTQAASLDFGVFALSCRVWGLGTATATLGWGVGFWGLAGLPGLQELAKAEKAERGPQAGVGGPQRGCEELCPWTALIEALPGERGR